MKPFANALIFACAACVCPIAPSAAADMARLEVMHNFVGSDGMSPASGLLKASDGNLYGTTYHGGPLGGGTVFRITPQGQLTTLHAFGDHLTGVDGSLPVGALIEGSDGNLHGTTSLYGDPGTGIFDGRGTVFRVTLSGVLTTRHVFRRPGGEQPFAALLQANDGHFYGTTVQGGAGGTGTIFRMTSDGTITTVYAFRTDASDGAQRRQQPRRCCLPHHPAGRADRHALLR